MRRCSLGRIGLSLALCALGAIAPARADHVVAPDSNVLRANAAARGVRHWNALAPFACSGKE